ncbi:LOW QUALITY PROTEIN: pyroglutamyl-peptidase 1-like protein [Lycodopsis pacificus]
MNWKAAQGLKLVGLGEQTDVSIKEVPKNYRGDDLSILNGEYLTLPSVLFAVHLGIARGSSVIFLEQTGKNSGYRDKDVCGFCPGSHCCVEGGPEKLDSVVNMRAVTKEFQQAGIDVVYSRDAGRHRRLLLHSTMCDFAYYCSLYHGQRRAALIHVPSSGSLTSADRLVPLLQSLVHSMLDQLEEPLESARREDDSDTSSSQR